MGRFGWTRKGKEQDENDTGNKNKEEVLLQNLLVFCEKKLEQGLKFRSEDLQEESNERKAQHNQHNQLVIQSQQMQAQQNQAIQALQQQQFRSLQ